MNEAKTAAFAEIMRDAWSRTSDRDAWAAEVIALADAQVRYERDAARPRIVRWVRRVLHRK